MVVQLYGDKRSILLSRVLPASVARPVSGNCPAGASQDKLYPPVCHAHECHYHMSTASVCVCVWFVQTFLNVHVQLCFVGIGEIPLVNKTLQVHWSRPDMPFVTSAHSSTPTVLSARQHGDMYQDDTIGQVAIHTTNRQEDLPRHYLDI